jgi:hypothetical protein
MTYLHEQMHWYVTWYSHSRSTNWLHLSRVLEKRYSNVPVGGSEGGHDAFSSRLHLVINWLEIETVSRFVYSELVRARIKVLPFYRWIYRTVLNDWETQEGLYLEHDLLPVRPATTMSGEDLKFAALANEFGASPIEETTVTRQNTRGTLDDRGG